MREKGLDIGSARTLISPPPFFTGRMTESNMEPARMLAITTSEAQSGWVRGQSKHLDADKAQHDREPVTEVAEVGNRPQGRKNKARRPKIAKIWRYRL